MPLEGGESKKAFGHNVATEMNAGKPQKQAVAIAYAEKRKGDALKLPKLDGEMCKSLADRADSLAKRFDAMCSRKDAETVTGLAKFVGQPVESK